jgi:ABC-type transport system involved in multi-copper enzyme maturation permease subunit
MNTIFLHQIHDNLRSLRFQVSLGILLLFFVANGVIYALKIDRLVAEDAQIQADLDRRLETIETLSDGVGNWYKILTPPAGTEFMAEAGFNWFQHALWLNPSTGETSWLGQTRTTNNWMRRFEVVDWALIVRYVLSFLCIVLSYNAISGELERGTLRLALSNSLSRGRFLMGKFFAHLVTLTVATVLGSAISLLILTLSGAVELDAWMAGRYLLFLLAATVFTSTFLLLGMTVSILARRSASSLVLLITAWTVLVVVIPQTSYLIAVHAVDPVGAFWERINGEQSEVREALAREGLDPRPMNLAKADNYAIEKRYTRRLEEMEKKINQMRRDVDSQQLRQYLVARQVNLLSPSFAFQYSLETFLGAGVQRFENFNRQGWRYRDSLRAFFRGRDAEDPDSPHIQFLPEFMSEKKLDSKDIPRYREVPLTVADSIGGGMTPIIVLVLEAALAFFLALWAFNRAELAG